MGDKKQKEALMKKVKQVLVVGACVLFVILMILSGMSSHWLTVFTVIKPGDTVIVDYTMNDINGKPVLTSDQQTYTQLAAKGTDVLFSKQLSVIYGQNWTKSIYPVTIFTGSTGETREYALFSVEFDAINQALTGMRAGDQKRIQLANSSMAQEWSTDQLTRNGVAADSLKVGDMLAMAVSDNPEGMITNTTTTYTRVGQVTSKTNDTVTVDFGYPSVDITVISINAKN